MAFRVIRDLITENDHRVVDERYKLAMEHPIVMKYTGIQERLKRIHSEGRTFIWAFRPQCSRGQQTNNLAECFMRIMKDTVSLTLIWYFIKQYQSSC